MTTLRGAEAIRFPPTGPAPSSSPGKGLVLSLLPPVAQPCTRPPSLRLPDAARPPALLLLCQAPAPPSFPQTLRT